MASSLRKLERVLPVWHMVSGTATDTQIPTREEPPMSKTVAAIVVAVALASIVHEGAVVAVAGSRESPSGVG